MNQTFQQVNLREAIIQLGTEFVLEILANYRCPDNKDVEQFLREKAILFSEQRLSATYLVFTQYKDRHVLVGYYTLADKILTIRKDSLSKTKRKRIAKFAKYDDLLKSYSLTAILIGQLGKNFFSEYNKLISGDYLLNLACNRANEIQLMSSGKIVFLECEDKIRLIEFYEKNGFYQFGKRNLDVDECDLLEGKYLIQLLRYL